jgi:alpha-galactosidase
MRALFLLFALALPCTAQTLSGPVTASGPIGIDAGPPLMSPTPQMGWSSWPEVSCVSCYNGGSVTAVTESVVEAESTNLANPTLSGLCAVEYPPAGSGCVSLTALGYKLVAIDATWDQCVSGSPPCLFEPIPANFPDGISGVASFVHAKSQLLSLYGSPGSIDCVSYPAQYLYEIADINLAASWNIDEWRYDWCPSSASIYPVTTAGVTLGYSIVGNAIANTGRPMGYDVNYYYTTSGPSWFQSVGGTRIRIGGDNPQSGSTWYSKAQGSLAYAIPYQNKGHWLDFDVLMGGLSENNQTQAVGDTEARAQFNFYAVVASPMLFGNLVENYDSTNLQTYANSEVIAVDQDSIGTMGTLASTTTCGSTVCQVWSRNLANTNPACVATGYTSCIAIALINYDPSAGHSITVSWSAIGISGTWNIRDLWLHASEGSSSTSYTFSAGAWGSTMLILSQ